MQMKLKHNKHQKQHKTKQATQTQQAPANATTNQPKQSTSGSSVNVNSHLQQIAQHEMVEIFMPSTLLLVQQVNINSYNLLGIQ